MSRRRGMPCTINGVVYESEVAAAKALKIGNHKLRGRLRSSNFPEYVSGHRAKEKRRRHPVPCSVAGVEYRSIVCAAKKLGITEGEMRTRLTSLDYPDYVSPYISKKPKLQRPMRYKAREKLYRTLQEIGDEEGITRERVRQKINSPLHPDYERL